MPMPYLVEPLTKLKEKNFTRAIRSIISAKDLTWGQKCLCVSLLDVVGGKRPTNRILANRLGIEPAQVSEWMKVVGKKTFEYAVGISQPQTKA